MKQLSLLFFILLLIFIHGCKKDDAENSNDSNTTYDADACISDTATWGKVTDSWSTTEGQFSDDNITWIRSQVPDDNIAVSLYYLKYETDSTLNYLSLGQYTIEQEFQEYAFDLMILTDYVGYANYFYVQVNGHCYRGELPTSALVAPEKALIEVSAP